MSMDWDLSRSLIKEKVEDSNFINELLVLEEVDSTNDFLKREIDNLQTPALVVANCQNAGKGSKGRSWISQPESGIWMSLLIKPSINMQKTPMLTLVMAVSVAEACADVCDQKIQIKWPNDIICNGKKICGILTEMKQSSAEGYGVVIGAGINVNTEMFPTELVKKATSLYLETGEKRQRFDLIGRVVKRFSHNYQLFLQKTDLSLLLDIYCGMSATIGNDVCVMDVNGSYNAKALKIETDGSLTVECEDGQMRSVYGDEVSVRGIYGYI